MLKRIMSLFTVLCLLPGSCAGLAEEVLPEAVQTVYDAAPEDEPEITGEAGTPEESAMQLTNECAHVNAFPAEYYWDPATVVYTADDDRTHTVTGRSKLFAWCNDCGQLVDILDEEWNENDSDQEPHSYVNNACTKCGHTNTCTHPNIMTGYIFDNNARYVPLDAVYHTVTGRRLEYRSCPDCGFTEHGEWVDNATDQQKHFFFGNECIDCGYEGCAHRFTTGEYEID